MSSENSSDDGIIQVTPKMKTDKTIRHSFPTCELSPNDKRKHGSPSSSASDLEQKSPSLKCLKQFKNEMR